MNTDQSAEYGYAQVEAALLAVFDVKGEHVAKLRSRLKMFQKVGLTPSKPGRGKIIKYTISNVYDWGFAVALADFGLDLPEVCELVKMDYFATSWVPGIKEREGSDALYCILFPHTFSPQKRVKGAPPFLLQWESEINGNGISELGGRLSLINLSQLKGSLDQALAQA